VQVSQGYLNRQAYERIQLAAANAALVDDKNKKIQRDLQLLNKRKKDLQNGR
jgi:hypothetical protein